MPVSLAEAAERKWGKPDIVEVPEDEWQKNLEKYRECKKALEELPEEEEWATPEELNRNFTE